MTEATITAPKTDSPASSENSIPSLDAIAAKMTAMRESAQRNRPSEPVADRTGDVVEADDSPVAPEAEPEVADLATPEAEAASDPDAQPDAVSADTDEDTTSGELIDFLEFAESNPTAKFRFMRNGQEVIIDAKKAAAILGQGSAIHEEARQLKIQRSEFEEYEREQRQRQEGLALAMEFTIEPRIQSAYDEIVKTQGYQTTFQQQLAATQDAAQQARIRASMQQNERYIQQQQRLIGELKPRVDEFRQVRQQQVSEVLDRNRRNFQDKELKNEFVYNEIRDKVRRGWQDAEHELIPGIKNIDLISSDEHILSLIRDGLKYRDRPTQKSAGASIAQLQNRKGTMKSDASRERQIEQLRDQAKGGDKKAADNLLTQRLSQIRQARSAR